MFQKDYPMAVFPRECADRAYSKHWRRECVFQGSFFLEKKDILSASNSRQMSFLIFF